MTIVVFPVCSEMTEDAITQKNTQTSKALRISSDACVRQTCTCYKKK